MILFDGFDIAILNGCPLITTSNTSPGTSIGFVSVCVFSILFITTFSTPLLINSTVVNFSSSIVTGKLGVKVDGVFGPLTEKAVKGFQIKHDLDVSVVVSFCFNF